MTKASPGRKSRRAARKGSVNQAPQLGTGERRLIGTTSGPQMSIPSEEFGHPGSPTELCVVAQFPGGDPADDHRRLTDTAERDFEAAALLSKTAEPFNSLDFNFSEADGASHFSFPTHGLHVDTQWGRVKVTKNPAGEAALVKMTCRARSSNEAIQKLQLACATFLDHWAYEATAPVYLGKLRANDTVNHVQVLRLISPFHSATINPSLVELPTPLRPMFALYREGLCASSPLYKFLCFYKILEGYFERMKPRLGKLFRERALPYPVAKELVPDHADLSDEVRGYVGKSISRLRDDFLTPHFRNAAAHFGEDGALPTITSDPREILRFGLMALPAELCARVVIDAGRQAIQAATTASLDVSSLDHA